jgi:hypothetical protein
VEGRLAQTADDATRAVSGWIASVLPDTPVSVRSCADWNNPKGIVVRLLSARPLPTSQGHRQALNIRLDYLVTLAFDDVMAEHHAIGELLFAAGDRADFQILSQEDAAALRREVNVPAVAGILLSMNLQRQKQQVRAPPVRRPLVVKSAPIGLIEGIVLGPADIPLVDAFVELPALNLSALTNFEGRFRLSGPLIPGQATKLIASKNHTRVGVDVHGDRPLTIRIPLET